MSEEIRCLLCSSGDSELLFWAEDIRHAIPGRYAWRRCASCGLVYLSPRPTLTEMASYYPGDYALFRTATEHPDWRPFRWIQQRDIQQRCRDAQRLIPRGRVLDIGCGTGEFLAAMKERGWESVGIEPSELAACYAREQFGLDVHSGRLEDVVLPDASFDVITLWTVVEHLHDPIMVMKLAFRLLRPDGLLVLSLPDPGSLDAHWFGPSWVGYDTPRHLSLFSPKSFGSLLAQSGFSLCGTGHSHADYYTFLASFDPWLRKRSWPRGLIATLNRASRLPGLRTATWPGFWLINLLGKGCIVTVYARPGAERQARSHRPGIGSRC
jgi:SAM-dependent methyltransferase